MLKTRLQKLLGIETKASISMPDASVFEIFGSQPSASGINVTPRTAMQCPPVHCAVQSIAEAIGQLPVHVYKRGVKGAKDRAPEHPAYKLLHDAANDWTPAAKFREDITRDALLYPNGGFAYIVRVDDHPFELIRLDPEYQPVRVTYLNGEPFYAANIGNGEMQDIPRQNIIHIPSPSLRGRGLIFEGRDAIGLAIQLERHASRLFANGARPSGLLSLKGTMTPDALTKAKASWQTTHGGDNSGGTAVIPADAFWQSLTLTSVDSQFLEMRKFAINEIARIFRVPSHMLFEMDRASHKNAEQAGTEFVVLGLMPWIRRWEGEILLKLFTPEERAIYYAEFLTDDFARADLATRNDALSKAIAARIINPNEARAMMNLPPYDGGDKFENPNTTSSVQP